MDFQSSIEQYSQEYEKQNAASLDTQYSNHACFVLPFLLKFKLSPVLGRRSDWSRFDLKALFAPHTISLDKDFFPFKHHFFTFSITIYK